VLHAMVSGERLGRRSRETTCVTQRPNQNSDKS
jgi:hypothetical protein